MKIVAEGRLFWFLKEGISLDLDDPESVDLYVQQVLTRGRSADVKTLLKNLGILRFKESFQRVENFFPKEIKTFWEDFLADYQSHPRNNP